MTQVVKNLPDDIADRIASFSESSYGAHRVVVILDDGREFREVYVAGAEVVRVGKSENIPFDPSRVIDVRDESHLR
jgi:hypothetical protein